MFRDPGLYAAVQGPSTVRMDMELKRRRSKIRVDRVVYPGRDRAPPMRKGGRPSSWADAFRFVGDRKVSCPEIQSGAVPGAAGQLCQKCRASNRTRAIRSFFVYILRMAASACQPVPDA